MRRVVGRTHGVDVVPLHQQHVLAHRLQVERAARLRVPLVAVDALEEDRRPVDLDQTVFEYDGPEPDPQRDALAGGGEDGVVQPGRLGGPRLHRKRHLGTGLDVEIQLRDRHTAGYVRVDAQSAGARDVVVGSGYRKVLDRALRAVQQGDVTEDPGKPPLVLVLQIGARRPLVDADRDNVAFRPQQPAHRELVGQARPLELAEFRAVQPDPGAGLHAVETQHRVPARRPVAGEVEDAQVVTGRVLGRDVRRVHRERIENVCVNGGAVALEHPVPRDRDLRPPPGVVSGRRERVVLGAGRLRQPEAPAAVQRQRGRVRGRVPGAGRERPVARRDVLDVGDIRGGGAERHRSPALQRWFSP
ncbi:hypothetical protein Saa2_09283 [Streptomyces acidiscabies]|nr:hypothetical protein Saa2_09283 [Streptomyces acidiscabies]